jgi:hypothetical protein
VAPRAVLVAENLLLRQQVIVLRRRVKRPPPRRFDRYLIGAVAGRFRHLFAAILMVKPETVIKWDRAGWRLLWRWRARRSAGRPPIDDDLRARIRRMWRDNPTWGENRIAGAGQARIPPRPALVLASLQFLSWGVFTIATASGLRAGNHHSRWVQRDLRTKRFVAAHSARA